jgi:transcriptional regulator with XRE-family HTH domain
LARRQPEAAIATLSEADESLGQRLRSLRLARAFSIAKLAVISGVPPSTISKIENGLLNPSLVHAINLASGLEANLGFLVEGARTTHARHAIVRRTQRSKRNFSEMGMKLEDLNIGFVPGLLEARIGTIRPGGTSGSARMTHRGEELVHVLAGAAMFDVDGVMFPLAQGDTLHFKCDVPHRWTNHAKEHAMLLFVFSDGLSF